MGENTGLKALRLLVLSALLLLVCGAQFCYAYNPGDPEFRAFWADAWGTGFLKQSQVDTLLGVPGTTQGGHLRAANCNAVIMQVRRNCDANYPSSMGEPYMGGLTPSDFNALQAVINAAHDTTGGKQRIEVHAWIVTFRTSGGKVYKQHSDPPTGSLTELDNYWVTRTNTGAEVDDRAFDPGHPLAADYAVNVAMDIVNNFDVDGIHFDYIRFTGNNQGYNPTSVARYNARYGLTGQPPPTDERWKQWRRDQITAVVRKVYAKVQASKPWVKVSGSPPTWNPSPRTSDRDGFKATRPYYDVYCDWDSWIHEGIFDAVMPMTYYDLAGSYRNDWARWIEFEKNRHGTRHMYIGPGVYMNSLANAITQIQQTRQPSTTGNYADGWSAYCYKQPYVGGTFGNFLPHLLAGVTGDGPVPVPDMPWKSNPTTGHISGTVTVRATGAWADGATVTITGPENRTMVCDGTGFYAFIDLTPGTYIVTASMAGLPNSTRTVEVRVGEVTGNMYVTDFVLGGPIISNIVASQMTIGYESITWNTDVPSTTQVEYGLTNAYGQTSELDPDLVTAHSVILSGLQPDTLYHYRVISSNPDGVSVSDDRTFIAIGPPKITNVGHTALTNYGATVVWETDQPATTQVEYGPTSSYGSITTLNPNLVTSHSQLISGLPALTEYHYRVISTNVNGTTVSEDQTFTTSGQTIITNVQVTNIKSDSATITWDTNAPADSKVSYGLTTSYTHQKTDPELVRKHSVTLTGLNQSTTYHFRCNSVNPYGTYTTIDYTFTTNAAPPMSPVTVTNITPDSATFTWTTTQLTDSTVACGYSANNYHIQVNDPAMVTEHSVTVTGLTSATRYHYKVYSANETGTGSLANAVFTTMDGPDDIVVDDSSPDFTKTGTSPAWLSNSSTNVGYLNSYKYVANRTTSFTNTCTWRPYLAQGNYDIYVYYPSVAGATTNATYTIRTLGGDIVRNINQTENPYQWNLLATKVPMPEGTTGYVRLNNTTGETSNTTKVLADAVKFVFTGIAGPPEITNVAASPTSSSATITWITDQYATSVVEYGLTTDYGTVVSDDAEVASHSVAITGLIPNTTYHYRVASTSPTGTTYSDDYTFRTPPFVQIIDDPEASYEGGWTIGGTPVNVYNGTYRFATINSSEATASATFTPNIPLAGAYNVYCHYNSGGNRTRAARYTITTAGGLETRTVNQEAGGGQWVLLAAGVQLTPDTGTVVLDNFAYDAGEVVISDGIMWTTAGIVPDTTQPTVTIGPPSAGLTRSGPVTYQITYDDNILVSGISLTAANVVLNKTGDADGTVTVSGGGTTHRTVTISNITGSGTLGISIVPGTAVDSSGNTAAPAGPSAVFEVDNTPPAIEISDPSSPITAAGPVTYTVTYVGAQSVGLLASDITLGTVGTATGTVSVSGTGNTTRLVTISDISGDGELFITIGEGTAVDAVGNVAVASEPSASFGVDNSTIPTATIGEPSAESTAGDPVSYTVVYDGAVSVTLTEADITLHKTGTANGTVSVTGEGTTRTVNIENITGQGTLSISIAAGTATSANGALAPEAGPSAAFSVTSEGPEVTVEIGAPSLAATSTGPVSYTVTYTNAPEITLSPSDITLNKTGTADGAVSVTGIDNITRTVTISNITGSGTLGISIAAGTSGAAAPAAGPSETFIVDDTPPTMAYVTDQTYSLDPTLLTGWWNGSDPESGIVRYEYAVGTNPDTALNDVVDWTDNGPTTSATISASLEVGKTYYISARAVNGAGLTSAPMTSSGVGVCHIVTSVRDAKALPTGAPVYLTGTEKHAVSCVFQDCFYVEDHNRIAGLRVEYHDPEGLIVPNRAVGVVGRLRLTDDEERAIKDIEVGFIVPAAAIEPLATPTKSLGGGDFGFNPGVTGGIGLNNTGLLVRIAGKVTKGVDDGFYVNDGGYLDDGIGTGVKVRTGTSGVPRENTYVIVTGVVSCRKVGGVVYPQILPRDIVTQ